jgi:murein L,D-transpeptidase YcbB/YkuD
MVGRRSLSAAPASRAVTMPNEAIVLIPPRTPRSLPQPPLAAVCAALAIAFAGLVGPAPAAAQSADAALWRTSMPPIIAAAPAANPAAGDSELRNRIDTTAGLNIAGESLRGALLRPFYAAFNFQPVWTTRPRQAEALLAAVWRAGEHGLDPELFHGALLRNPTALPPIDRDLLLSDAFLAYADALARGAVPIERRGNDDLGLAPEPLDVPGALVKAVASPDPVAAVLALAPQSSDYQALQRALKALPPGTLDKTGSAMRQQLVVNLERWRWLPRDLPADRVWVNAASAQLVLYRANEPVFTTRVVVGQPTWQTPELQTSIEALIYNPPWNVPPSIAEKEILPKLEQDPDYLARHNMVRRANGGLQQLPGHGTALGYLKFEMPNRFDVYLHDTPMRQLFARDNRRQSHGCVRVQNPRDLGALLIGQPVETINQGIAGGATTRRNLPTPVTVFIVYHTASVGTDGKLEFRPDVYNRDGDLWQRLHPARQAPVAQHDPAGQRRG